MKRLYFILIAIAFSLCIANPGCSDFAETDAVPPEGVEEGTKRVIGKRERAIDLSERRSCRADTIGRDFVAGRYFIGGLATEYPY